MSELDPKGFYLKKHPNSEFVFRVHHKDTGDVQHGTISLYDESAPTQAKPVSDKTTHIYVGSFSSYKIGHPSKDGRYQQNYFGPSGIKAIGHSLREMAPRLKTISAYRISGIRSVAGQGSEDVTKDVRLLKGMPKFTLRHISKETEPEEHGGRTEHEFSIHEADTGEQIGLLSTEYGGPHPKGEVHVNWVHAGQQGRLYATIHAGQHSIGAQHIRPLVKELKRHIPEMTTISGNRVSGIRRGPAARPEIRATTMGGYGSENLGSGVHRKTHLPEKLFKALDPKGFYLHSNEKNGDFHSFHVRHRETGDDIHGRLSVLSKIGSDLSPDTKSLYINGFYSEGTGHASKGGEDQQNYFGPAGVRAITRSLKEHYPKLEHVKAYRVSGIRVTSTGYSHMVDKGVHFSKSQTSLDPKGFYLHHDPNNSDHWESFYHIRHKDTGDTRYGDVGVHEITTEGQSTLKITHIRSEMRGTRSRGGEPVQNYFGPSGIRALKDSLKTHYPDAKHITGYRVSGIRMVSGRGEGHANMQGALEKALNPSKFYLRNDNKQSPASPYQTYEIHHEDTGETNHGYMSISRHPSDPSIIHVDNLGSIKQGHTSKSGYTTQNYFGPAGVRAITRSLKEHYPLAQTVRAYRVSGMRRVSGGGNRVVDKPNILKSEGAQTELPLHGSGDEHDKYYLKRGEPTILGQNWHIKDKKTDAYLGRISVSHSHQHDPTVLHVDGFYSRVSDRSFDNTQGQHVFGVKGIREIRKHLKRLYPEARHVEATRVSGMRAISGRNEDETVYKHDFLKSQTAEEFIHAAAIKVGDKVYEGKTHFKAAQEAMRNGENKNDVARALLHHEEGTGFTTTSGRFLTRKAAKELAVNTKQVVSGVPSHFTLDSGDVIFKSLKITDTTNLFADRSLVDHHSLHFRNEESGVFGHVKYYIDGSNAHVTDVRAVHPKDEAHSDYTQNSAGKNAIGPKDIMQLQRYLVKRHGIKSISTNSRVSGIRNYNKPDTKFHIIKRELPATRIENMGKAITLAPISSYFTRYDPQNRHHYAFKHNDTEGSIQLELKDRGKTAFIHDIQARHSYSLEYLKGANTVGPKGVLELKDAILARHPTITRFATDDRISGARHHGRYPGTISEASVFNRPHKAVAVDLPPHRLGKTLTIQHHSEMDYPDDITSHVYHFAKEGSDAKGVLRFEVNRKSGLAYINNIWTHSGSYMHPGENSYNAGRNRFGPEDMMQLQRHIVKQHPEITKLQGRRISGARHKGQTVANSNTIASLELPANRRG